MEAVLALAAAESVGAKPSDHSVITRSAGHGVVGRTCSDRDAVNMLAFGVPTIVGMAVLARRAFGAEEVGVEPRHLHLLHVGRAARAAREAEMDEIRAAEILLGKVARQRATELTVDPIRQCLGRGIPRHLSIVPIAVFQVAERGLRRKRSAQGAKVRVEEAGLVGTLGHGKCDPDPIADAACSESRSVPAKSIDAKAIVVQDE